MTDSNDFVTYDETTGTPTPLVSNPGGNNVIDLLKFKKDKQEGKAWPVNSATPETTTVVSSATDPTERNILISTPHGDVQVQGYLGLSQTFLAVGRPDGSIKFAAAPGMWLYAVDVTDNPDYIEQAT